jgi:uncharacterized protein YndB with AHSA1/START domain
VEAGTSAVEHEVRIAARPETVFAYFTDPAKMVQWMGIDATLDPRPGGVCRINVNGAGVALGKYVQVDPPSRIVFTWGWERDVFSTPPQSTAVEVSFTPVCEETILRLSHTKLPAGADIPHRAGWGHYLERLALVAAGTDPGADPWRDPAVAEQALRAYLAEARGT